MKSNRCLTKLDSPASFNSNVISDADWVKLENAGCTFLPAAGYRDCHRNEGVLNVDILQVNEFGYYWSSSMLSTSDGSPDNAWAYIFHTANGTVSKEYFLRCFELSVRTVYKALHNA